MNIDHAHQVVGEGEQKLAYADARLAFALQPGIVVPVQVPGAAPDARPHVAALMHPAQEVQHLLIPDAQQSAQGGAQGQIVKHHGAG